MWNPDFLQDASPVRSPADTSVCCAGADGTCLLDVMDSDWSAGPTLLDCASADREAVCQRANAALCHLPASCVSHSCELRLAERLGPLIFNLEAQAMPLGRDLQAAVAFLQPWPQELRSDFPAHLDLRTATLRALAPVARAAAGKGVGPIDTVHVYTDGSFNGSRSAWAVVCVGLRAGEVACVRWFHGAVCLDSTSPVWLGADRRGVQEAELSALCYALLWILSACRTASCKLVSDSLISVQRARGLWQFPLDCTIAFTCRCLSQAIEALQLSPWQVIGHVRAHKGEQWNELADALARSAVDHESTFCYHVDIGSWIRDRSLESLWRILAAWQQPTACPQLIGSRLVADDQVRFEDVPAASLFGIPAPDSSQRQGAQRLLLRLVSANVQTLEGGCDATGLHAFEGRVGFLREQFYCREAHIVAIQEARTERAETILSSHVHPPVRWPRSQWAVRR